MTNPIETHAKNLAWVEEWITANRGLEFNKFFTTLRNVLELHRPNEKIWAWADKDDEPDIRCISCDNFEEPTYFPCTTYSTITEGLGI